MRSWACLGSSGQICGQAIPGEVEFTPEESHDAVKHMT